MIIPGFLISILTFPGVIVHEAAHLLFCKLRKVPVLEVCFFRFGNPAGYVVHAETDSFATTFLVSVGPFFVNSLLCVLLCFPVFYPSRAFGYEDLLTYPLLWVGLSIGMHAFPSTGDARNLWRHAKIAVREKSVLALVSFPLVALIFVANILRVIWFDLAYGVALGVGLPELLLKLAARA